MATTRVMRTWRVAREGKFTAGDAESAKERQGAKACMLSRLSVFSPHFFAPFASSHYPVFRHFPSPPPLRPPHTSVILRIPAFPPSPR